MAEGAAESTTNDLVSGLVGCGWAIVACIAASSAVASSDVAPA